MRTIRLNNGTKRNSIPGQLVRVDPKNKRNFIPVDINELDVIGTVAEATKPGAATRINLLNSVSWKDISSIPKDIGSSTELTKAAIEAELTGEITSHTHPAEEAGGMTPAKVMTLISLQL